MNISAVYFRIIRDECAPWTAPIAHALLGAAGLVLLLLAIVNEVGSLLATASLGLLVLATLGGFYAGLTHLRRRLPLRGIGLAHASLAIIAWGAMLVTTMNVQ